MDHIEKSKELGLSNDEYVLVGGSVLDVYGIRKSDDIDVIVSPNAFARLMGEGWEVDTDFQRRWGRERLVRDMFEIYRDLYYRKVDYYLSFKALKDMSNVIQGTHIQPLGHLLLAKLDNRREKDMLDVKLIEDYFNGQE